MELYAAFGTGRFGLGLGPVAVRICAAAAEETSKPTASIAKRTSM
jgi:hypothetical protein